MLIVLPVGTDAPCYHPPFATFGLVLLNVVVLVCQFVIPGFTELFVLHFGSFNPISWLTSSVMHAGIGHLIGNMIVLSICGWIIEGKVGWWRMIAIYFSIAFVSGGIEQTIMLFFDEGFSLGASGVCYGLMAITMIWAPENEVTLFAGGIFFFYPFATKFNVSILGITFILLAIEFLSAAFSGFVISSAVLHLLGAIPGAVIGYEMVRRRWVDCEGYDLLSIQAGKRGQRVITVQEEKEIAQRKIDAKREADDALDTSKQMVDNYVSNKHFEMALNRYEMHRKKDRRFQLTESQMVSIINGLWNIDGKRPKAVSLIELYLESYQTLKVPMTLKLARYELLEQERPKKCLLLIKSISREPLDEKQNLIVKQMIAKAKQMISDGVIEF